MRIRAIRPEDFWYLDVQDAQRDELVRVRDRLALIKRSITSTWAATFEDDSGILAITGITPEGSAWAFFRQGLRRKAVPVFRAAYRAVHLYSLRVGPVSATIDPGFQQGVRLAIMIGFRPSENGNWLFDHTRALKS